MERRTHSVDSMAVVLYNQVAVKIQKKLNAKRDVMISSKPFAKIVNYVTNYSIHTAKDQFAAWQNLEVELLVKFMDGNVIHQDEKGAFKSSPYSKGQPAKVEQPGYTDLWKETVAQEHGSNIQVP